MIKRVKKVMDGNTAAAHVAYAFTEVAAIYPITPSTPMAEMTEVWATTGRNFLGEPAENVFGEAVHPVEMQSEAGAAGAVHGSLSAGALTTTYTASQGLLLMIPNMYKMAGEALPAVIHAAARTVATHALSIFGDHSDVYACRQTGFAMLAESNPQEVMDLAPVAHMAAIEGRVPFLNFFDGFRTSHEQDTVEAWHFEQLKALLDLDAVRRFRLDSLNPARPCLRGSAENGDIYFQHREAANRRYDALPQVVSACMARVNAQLGTDYRLFNYEGSPDADRVIVAMGSFTDTVAAAVNALTAKGEKVGVVRVRLYRPFSVSHFVSVLPKTVRKIAVMDRTKEAGAIGEPLYLDVVAALEKSGFSATVVGGRYGLASKDTPPEDAVAIFEHLKEENPRHGFTVGITDDVTGASLAPCEVEEVLPTGTVSCKLWGLGGDGTVGASKNIVKIIGDHTEKYVQGYFQYDSKKTGGVTVSHLRFGEHPIRAPYYVKEADLVACHNAAFLKNDFPLVREVKPGGVLLLDFDGDEAALNALLSDAEKQHITENGIDFFVIDAAGIARDGAGNVKVKNTVLQTAFFLLSGVLPFGEAVAYMRQTVRESYAKFGAEVVEQNLAAIELAKTGLKRITLKTDGVCGAALRQPQLAGSKEKSEAGLFARRVLWPVNRMMGDRLPVSAFLDVENGSFPSGTTAFEKRGVASYVSDWIPENCIACGTCAFVCPHATVRISALTEKELQNAPQGFQIAPKRVPKTDYAFAVVVSPLDCMGCTLCVKACPVNQRAVNENGQMAAEKMAITMVPREAARKKQDFFDYATERVTEKRELFSPTVKGSQFRQPLLEFSGACAGCAETVYARLVTQLFGERMYISNATGCSSIWGCSAPSAAYTKNKESGHGPAWANSLFEDNAEHGFGLLLGQRAQRERLRRLVRGLREKHGEDALGQCCEKYLKTYESGTENEGATEALIRALSDSKAPVAAEILEGRAYLSKKSVWIFGGDGWAYDIGFGGVDHVLAMGADVNMLVFDTEIYSNTGGQISKASGCGQVAQLAIGGKSYGKKSLAEMMLSYGHVYVAQVSLGASMPQLLKALTEAEAYAGPSLIVAYSPCELHGIRRGGLKNSGEEMKRAVETGYFPLFRYHPLREKDKLTIDSAPPKGDFAAFLAGETRYARLLEKDPERAAKLFKTAEEQAKARYARLCALREVYS